MASISTVTGKHTITRGDEPSSKRARASDDHVTSAAEKVDPIAIELFQKATTEEMPAAPQFGAFSPPPASSSSSNSHVPSFPLPPPTLAAAPAETHVPFVIQPTSSASSPATSRVITLNLAPPTAETRPFIPLPLAIGRQPLGILPSPSLTTAASTSPNLLQQATTPTTQPSDAELTSLGRFVHSQPHPLWEMVMRTIAMYNNIVSSTAAIPAHTAPLIMSLTLNFDQRSGLPHASAVQYPTPSSQIPPLEAPTPAAATAANAGQASASSASESSSSSATTQSA